MHARPPPSDTVHAICLEVLDHLRRLRLRSLSPRTPFNYSMHEEEDMENPTPLAPP
jgi:hypothetical protein